MTAKTTMIVPIGGSWRSLYGNTIISQVGGNERGKDRHSNDLVCGASLHQCPSLTGLERIVMLIINVTSLRVLDAVNTLLLLLLLTLPDSMNHGA